MPVVLHPEPHTTPIIVGLVFLSVFSWAGIVTLATIFIGSRHIRRRNSR